MKFITSTDLKQWADTKECQQLLPELIKKLIDASVSNIDKLSFPSGDATYLPGWDGIVDCKENIDLVPSGISLWECGATDSVKSKIDGDFKKRNENPLGYDKSKSTFVFVTPRIWEGVEEWLQNNQNGWEKIIIYTAIELERWIDNTPSVGIWLAERLKKLPSGGYICPETYWKRWAQGESITLPYDIILHGREKVSSQIIETCKNRKPLFLQALSQNEGIAFVIASLMTSNDADGLIDRTIVVTEKNAYDDFVEHYNNLIIITTLSEGVHYSTKRGHTVIVATTPAEQISETIKLPIIEKGQFVGTLVKIGFDEAKARKIATDTARDINVFRRRIKIVVDKPKWADSFIELLPAILIGKWNGTCDGDKEILASLSGMEYGQCELKLNALLSKEETPLIHISNMWRIRSPYESIEYLLNIRAISEPILSKYRTICLSLIQDDDSEAVDAMKSDGFYFRKFNQKYSNTIKEGIFQNLCLLSILDDSENGSIRQWVDETVTLMLKDWTLCRFLSNRHFFTALAEASPNGFLAFMEKLSQELLDEVLKPQKHSLSLSGWEIFYTEILFSLEMLAWDKDFLYRVVRLLLRFSEYKNESNYVNKPENSLYNIYRFYLPQTYVSFEDRMNILKALSTYNRKSVYRLCKRICESVNAHVLDYSHYFRWRLFGQLMSPHKVQLPSVAELNSVTALMLQCCDYSAIEISDLLTLSSDANMGGIRKTILDAVNQHIVGLVDTQIVVDALRKDITRHKQCEGAKWALTDEELIPYQKLLSDFEPKDILQKNAWLFEEFYVQLPYKRNRDTNTKRQELYEVRLKALKEIVDEKGEDGLWDFVQIVKCPESLSQSIVSYFNDKLNDDVCQKYKHKEISETFTRSYFTALCYKSIPDYVAWAEKLMVADEEMAIVLYAPGYVEELSDIAENQGVTIKRCYWESINIDMCSKKNTQRVIRELINVNRFSEAIEIIYFSSETIQIADVEIVQILYRYLTVDSVHNRRLDTYYITSLLEKLDKSEDPDVVRLLVMIEFLLYQRIEHQMDMSKSRFRKELSRNPELMIQLVELAFLPDDGNVEQLEGIDYENRKLMAKCAWHILHFGHCIVTFNSKEEVFDGEYMKQYIEQLYHLAKERKRTKVIDHIVGNLLGDIPRDSNYPPQALCELVENLNNDNVDQSIRIRIYNSRGITSRAYNEGGDQERSIVSTFEKYKEKTRLLYPRMTEIFNQLIKEYKNEAGRVDDEAKIADLDY